MRYMKQEIDVLDAKYKHFKDSLKLGVAEAYRRLVVMYPSTVVKRYEFQTCYQNRVFGPTVRGPWWRVPYWRRKGNVAKAMEGREEAMEMKRNYVLIN